MNFLQLLTAATADTAAKGGDMASMLVTMVLPIVAMIAIFYFLIIRPEKKRAAKEKNMRESLQVADEVVTTGGIIGRVLRVTEDTVLIETGSDITKIRVLKSSIAENRTVHDEAESK